MDNLKARVDEERRLISELVFILYDVDIAFDVDMYIKTIRRVCDWQATRLNPHIKYYDRERMLDLLITAARLVPLGFLGRVPVDAHDLFSQAVVHFTTNSDSDQLAMRNVLLYIATTLNIPIVHYQTDNDEGILTRILEFSGVYELHPTRMDMQSQFIKDTHVSLSIANIHVPIGDNLFKELQQTFEKSKRRD